MRKWPAQVGRVVANCHYWKWRLIWQIQTTWRFFYGTNWSPAANSGQRGPMAGVTNKHPSSALLSLYQSITCGFPTQRDNNAKPVSTSWRHNASWVARVIFSDAVLCDNNENWGRHVKYFDVIELVSSAQGAKYNRHLAKWHLACWFKPKTHIWWNVICIFHGLRDDGNQFAHHRLVFFLFFIHESFVPCLNPSNNKETSMLRIIVPLVIVYLWIPHTKGQGGGY